MERMRMDDLRASGMHEPSSSPYTSMLVAGPLRPPLPAAQAVLRSAVRRLAVCTKGKQRADPLKWTLCSVLVLHFCCLYAL